MEKSNCDTLLPPISTLYILFIYYYILAHTQYRAQGLAQLIHKQEGVGLNPLIGTSFPHFLGCLLAPCTNTYIHSHKYRTPTSQAHCACTHVYTLAGERTVMLMTASLYLLLMKPQVFYLGWIQKQPVIQHLCLLDDWGGDHWLP